MRAKLSASSLRRLVRHQRRLVEGLTVRCTTATDSLPEVQRQLSDATLQNMLTWMGDEERTRRDYLALCGVTDRAAQDQLVRAMRGAP